MVVLGETIMPYYDAFAQGAVAWADTVAVTGHSDATLMFCPHVAAALGWRNDTADIFAYRNSDGEVAARTIRWRDGGLRSDNTDRQTVRTGQVVVVKSVERKKIVHYFNHEMIFASWRSIKSYDRPLRQQSAFWHRREV